MKSTFTLILSLLFTLTVFAQQEQKDETYSNLEVSLLTCSPGDELYSAFGHTAIKVNDMVFNYGMFNFNTEGFYLKFVSGQTDYELGVELMDGFERQYERRGRGVIEQKLNLTNEEKAALFGALIENTRPENKTYRYNFVFDNCATRPRVKIEECLKGNIQYDVREENDSYRKLIEQYVGEDSWIKFGIDILIGAEADKTASFFDRLFLPDELMNAFAKAKRENGERLVKETNEVVEQEENADEQEGGVTPLAATVILMTIVSIASLLFPRKLKVLDFVLFLITGLLGVVVAYLCFFSLHPLVGENYNLLWLNPLHLLIPLTVFIKKARKFLLVVYMLTALSAIVAITGYIYLPQEFNIAFLPIMVMIVVRALSVIKTQKGK
ncbi:MAG: DUF4105 domain-containing protein [Paludibacteraceae bacterium]|nr:DUF4105 domain-containing protein [Paludibacteraceae bacterium]MBP5743160.1 DUF4105 domain-containing protein [Paludibacteraceae bacterium]